MTTAEAEPPTHSFDICSESELYPKKNPVCDEEGLAVPFPPLYGESVEYLGRVTEGVIALSNYRLLIRAKKWFVNIPLGLIDSVDTREIFYIIISCKDATTVRCSFPTNDWCLIWYKRLVEKTGSPKDLNHVFAMSFHAWCMDDNASGSPSSSSQTGPALCHINEETSVDKFDKEVVRMKFDTAINKVWRMSHINDKYSACPSYPKIHIVPTSISDENLMSVAGFRSMKRFPSVVWRSQRNGAVIVRCSQPELGWLGWRNTDDENLLSAIPQACALNPGFENILVSGQTTPDENGKGISITPNKMLLIDCRSYGAAFANRAKGGGCESADYYPCCEIQFMNLANIHSIRKSFFALRTLTSAFTEHANWMSSLENTKWLHYIGALIRAANLAVVAVDKEARPVLVHCSDGWDRTPQIVALAQLLLDPHYRKIEGFQALIEREWFEFGHKFADRCGHSFDNDDPNERSPIFLQWLDCVFQVHRQFPCAFEFNEAYLIKLVHHTYSRLFGVFMFNTTRERAKENLSKRTTSIWSLLHPKNKKFHNLLYNEMTEQQVLYPEFSINKLTLWSSVYLCNSSLSTNATEDFSVALETGEITPDIESTSLQKTRSCENLAKLPDHTPLVARRLSDPNILHGSQELLVAGCKDIDVSIKNLENGNTEETLEANKHNEDEPSLPNGNIVNGIDTNSEQENSDSDENTVTVSDSNDNIISENQDIVETSMDKMANDKTNNDIHLLNAEIIDNKYVVNGYIDSVKLSRKSIHKSDESSTDTITDDEFLDKKTEDNVYNGISNGHINGYGHTNGHTNTNDHTNGLTNGHVTVEELDNLENNQYLIKRNFLRSTMSTSTSDISDSYVGPFKEEWDQKLNDSRLLSHFAYCTPSKLYCGAGHFHSKPNMNSASPSPSSSPFPTPFNSRTPNSTCPPTPDTATKSCDWATTRQLNGVGRHLDCDGLTTFVDRRHQRMQQKETEYQRQIDSLTYKLNTLQKLLRCNGTQRLDLRGEELLLPEDTDSDHCSLGNISNPASDVSWENLDVKDSPLTLWMPDHAVTHCAGCLAAFWTAKRKHHCRSCGKIYCADCSNFYSPVPNQLLKEPVRVCRTCHDALQHPVRELVEDQYQPQMVQE